MSITQNRCSYCRCLFTPDPRTRNHQKVCGKSACQAARKKDAQERWLEKNQDYFKGRYVQTKEWLATHAGYLHTYRESHPEYVEKNRIKQKERRARQKQANLANGHSPPPRGVDIQDGIITPLPEKQGNRVILPIVDIQDTILSLPVEIIGIRPDLPCVDIQDDTDRRLFSGYIKGKQPVVYGFSKPGYADRRHVYQTHYRQNPCPPHT